MSSQRLGKVHSLYIGKEAWLIKELRGGSKTEVKEDEDHTVTKCEFNARIRLFYRREQEKVDS